MSFKFESFHSPIDGITKLVEIDRYGCHPEKEGWSLHGVVSVDRGDDGEKLYGIYRMTDNQALASALAETKAATEAQAKAEAEARKLGDELKKLKESLFDAQSKQRDLETLTEKAAELRVKAQERFGSAFDELVNA